LQAIETAGFDLVTIDVNMSVISGYELAKHAANRNIPALLSSGHPDTKFKEYDCPYLAKPFRIADLLSETAEAITHADENIRHVRVSLARLEATTDGLDADLAVSRRLMSESKSVSTCNKSL
jgi:DNA-binding NtrC family response regulator